VNTAMDLTLIGTLAALWLSAGLLVDRLPTARTARELRRRARALSMLVGGGGVVLAAVALLPGADPARGVESAAPAAALLPAVPAVIALTVTLRRLAQIRRGAGAFATAPLTPAPPALRAAAAHPLVATPLQVTGLAAVAGVPIAAGSVEVPGADMAGILLTAVGVVVLALGIRHAIRHSRLTVAVLAPIGKGRLSALPTLPTPAETYAALPAEAMPAAASQAVPTGDKVPLLAEAMPAAASRAVPTGGEVPVLAAASADRAAA
jgi:hypothetical protein